MNNTPKTTVGTVVPIVWNVPEEMKTAFVTRMVIQTMENDIFKVLFFEIQPPIHFADSGEYPSAVNATCRANITVTTNTLKSFIDTLQREYEKYTTRRLGH